MYIIPYTTEILPKIRNPRNTKIKLTIDSSILKLTKVKISDNINATVSTETELLSTFRHIVIPIPNKRPANIVEIYLEFTSATSYLLKYEKSNINITPLKVV